VSARTYVLSPRDRTGVLLGLSGLQTGVLGAAVVLFAVAASLAGVLVAIPLSSVVAAGAVRVGGRSVVEVLPLQCRRVAELVRPPAPWLAVLPITEGERALPPATAGQVILAIDPQGRGFPGRVGPIAVVHDRAGRRLAVTVRAEGQRFALLDRDDQDRQAQLWGDALAPFASSACPIVAVRWTEWVAPAGMEDQHAWLAEQAVDPDAGGYRALVSEAAPVVAGHEVLLTLVVADRTVAGRRGRAGVDAAVDALLSEVRLFGQRLEAAGIEAHGPLTPAEVRAAVRMRLDPSCRSALDRRARTLGERSGLAAGAEQPLSASSTWRQWTVDGTLHRAFYVAEWPRLPVAADWLQGLVLHAGVVRTVGVTYEPVPAAASRRRVERQVTKLATDAEQRTRTGFRVDGQHQRASQAVLDREQELVSGYAEFAYVGLVEVSARDEQELDRAAEELVQVAASVGIDLRPLHGRHDLAVAALLPLARTVAPTGLLS
jgi:hypothetical protein